jgi:hypothetical protein
MAAKLLKLSVRHIRRLKNDKLKKIGVKGLIHGNKGKAGHNKLSDKETIKIKTLLRKHYYDFGPTFASEKLSENHHINHDPKTIRQIMIDEGLWKPRTKRRQAEHRSWRERKPAYGEMIQFDGSYHDWFEKRNNINEVCLLAAIDDATSKVTKAKFDYHEGVFPVFSFWQEYILKNGKPRSIYLDKFSTYKINHKLAKENEDTLTQFQRAMAELKVEVIPANSPQAKGRVERLFGTFQDRLVKELRLSNISTVSKANEFIKIYLPKFNAKFSVQPRSKIDLHQKLSCKEQNKLDGILSRQTARTVQNDFTLSFKNLHYQLTKEQPATICKKDKVIVEERTDNTIRIRLKGKYLNYNVLPIRPEKIRQSIPWVIAKTTAEVDQSKAHKPPINHPWRNAIYSSIVKQRINQGMTF